MERDDRSEERDRTAVSTGNATRPAEATGTEGETPADEDEQGGSVAGGNDWRMPVEPEPVDLENALFVLLGVAVTLAVFAQFVVG
jgi:hypothetical protein